MKFHKKDGKKDRTMCGRTITARYLGTPSMPHYNLVTWSDWALVDCEQCLRKRVMAVLDAAPEGPSDTDRGGEIHGN